MAVYIKGQSSDKLENLVISAAATASKARSGHEPISFYMNILIMMLSDLDFYLYQRIQLSSFPTGSSFLHR